MDTNIQPSIVPRTSEILNKGGIIFFDGVCNLCNASVDFIISRDKQKRFLFAPLQSSFAKEKLAPFGIDMGDMITFVLLSNNKAYTRSTAALHVMRGLGGLWPLLYVFIIVPAFIRDFFYNLVARNRYRWFGKRDTCRIPTPEERSRFIDLD